MGARPPEMPDPVDKLKFDVSKRTVSRNDPVCPVCASRSTFEKFCSFCRRRREASPEETDRERQRRHRVDDNWITPFVLGLLLLIAIIFMYYVFSR